MSHPVFASRDGRDYAMNRDGLWFRWPAVKDGWRSRRECPATDAAEFDEMPPRLGKLALLLSGAPTDAE